MSSLSWKLGNISPLQQRAWFLSFACVGIEYNFFLFLFVVIFMASISTTLATTGNTDTMTEPNGVGGVGDTVDMADSKSPLSEQNISYSAQRIIGNGSFGVVFEAKVVETGKVVAIKKVLQDKRFKNRELQIMRQLVKDPHPNIVALEHCFYSQVSVWGPRVTVIVHNDCYCCVGDLLLI